MKNLFLLSFIFIAFLSCNKEKSANPCTDNSLIRKVKSGDFELQQLTYNGNCQIYESIEPYVYTKYSYDQSGRLTKAEQAVSLGLSCSMLPGASGEKVIDPRKAKISIYSVFEYDSSGRLQTKSDYYINDSPQLLSVNKYEYIGNQIVKLNIVNPDNSLEQYDSYTYDNKGNIVRDDNYMVSNGTEATLSRSTEYEFDDRINPFFIFALTGEPGLNTNSNNITKETTTYYNAGTEYQNIIEYQIEYNTAGYPVKINDKTFLYGN
jgi:hypothetical protein